jgi:hypothetical protein
MFALQPAKTQNINILTNNNYSSEDMKPPNVTFDNPCIIDLERNRENAPLIRKLVQMHRNKEICLRVVATSASELKPDKKTHPQHFDEFKQRMKSIGLDDVQILLTLGRLDVSFFDYSIYSDRWKDELEKEIQAILFGENEVEFSDFCRKHGYDKENKEAWNEWIRRKCDVLTLWGHIWYNGDIFVTNDSNFHKETKKPRLTELGSGKILRPLEAVKMLDC